MAITITEQPIGPILNAYNNSILRFGTDSGSPARAVVLVNDQRSEITPNKGQFYINIKSAVKMIINQDAFSDTLTVQNGNIVIKDYTLTARVTVDISVFLTNGNLESKTLELDYTKAVEQLFPEHYVKNNSIRVLSPSIDNIKNLTYFEGYPFDIPIYSNNFREITISNMLSGQSITFQLLKGVSRIFLSNGENDNNGFENTMPLALGNNILKISYDGGEAMVQVNKKPVRCGVYLKFFNEEGAWSYWLFEGLYTGKISHRTIGTVNRDYSNIDKTMAREIITGKTAGIELSLNTGIIDVREQKVLEQIYSSAKCYMYSKLELQPFKPTDFKAVQVKDGSNDIINTKMNMKRFEVNIELPQKYTQTYAG